MVRPLIVVIVEFNVVCYVSDSGKQVASMQLAEARVSGFRLSSIPLHSIEATCQIVEMGFCSGL
jgi:hypothetical protein